VVAKGQWEGGGGKTTHNSVLTVSWVNWH